VRQAEINLQRTEVRSPVNGIVTNLLLREGDYARQGATNVSIIDADSYWIDGYFEETKMAHVCIGDRAEAALMGYRDPIVGQVQTVTRGISVSNATPSTHGLPNVAPVYPWIYTGGIDPYLWRPIPGVQTLNFVPYRVDLTPFAGTFDDGASHQVALSVFNANHYFSVTGTLLLFLDPDAHGALSGGLDTDTLAAAPPVNVTEGGSYDASGNGSGSIDTSSRRDYVIAGHARSAHAHGTNATTAAAAPSSAGRSIGRRVRAYSACEKTTNQPRYWMYGRAIADKT